MRRSISVSKFRPLSIIAALRNEKSRKLSGRSLGLGINRTANQRRNHGNISLQCRFNLDTHEIVFVIDPGAASLACASPIGADDSDQHVGAGQGIIHDFAKIDSEGNIVDIPEHRILSVPLHKSIKNPARHIGIGAPVSDSDLGHGPAIKHHPSLYTIPRFYSLVACYSTPPRQARSVS
jgi:hypothetical protein